MEDSFADSVVEELKGRLHGVDTALRKISKNKTPFRQEPVSWKEELYFYETQGYQMFEKIADQFGMDKAVQWRDYMEQQKARRSGNG